jgi:hypothetical protein
MGYQKAARDAPGAGIPLLLPGRADSTDAAAAPFCRFAAFPPAGKLPERSERPKTCRRTPLDSSKDPTAAGPPRNFCKLFFEYLNMKTLDKFQGN